MTCPGFSKEGLRFLTTLGSEDKAWFDARRSLYDEEIVGDFVAWCMPRLAACAPIHRWLVQHQP